LLSLVFAIGKIGLLAVIVLVVGGKLIPAMLMSIARTRSRELFTLSVLAVALLIAVGAAVLFDASMALGAFLAGMVVGASKLSEAAASDALPMKDAFAVIFFVATGMLFDPSILLENYKLFLLLMVIILLAKPLTALLIVVGLGYSSSAALTVAIGLAQIGEFSFILSGEASRLGLLPEAGGSVLVAAAIFSIALNPLLFMLVPKLERSIRSRPQLWNKLNRRAAKRGQKANETAAGKLAGAAHQDKAVIVGYGPVGRTLTRLLRESGVHTVIVDTNVDTISALHEEGGNAIFGDACKADILKAAGIEQAKYLVVTPPELGMRIPVINTARNLTRDLIIYSRARYISERRTLQQFGVTQICAEELESAVVLAEMVMQNQGLDEAKIEAEILNIRKELG
jgi:CPA2 family monovalent cation:H+ antiporter-2